MYQSQIHSREEKKNQKNWKVKFSKVPQVLSTSDRFSVRRIWLFICLVFPFHFFSKTEVPFAWENCITNLRHSTVLKKKIKQKKTYWNSGGLGSIPENLIAKQGFIYVSFAESNISNSDRRPLYLGSTLSSLLSGKLCQWKENSFLNYLNPF